MLFFVFICFFKKSFLIFAYTFNGGIELENSYRGNIVDFALTHLDKNYVWGSQGPEEFDETSFSFYIYKELFDLDIERDGYGVDHSTKQMTNSIGNLTKYIENDTHKEKYLDKIQAGDLVFFHTKSLKDNQPTASNQYPGSVGIYLGEKKFIHADSEVGKVIICDLAGEWLNQLVASRDIVSGFVLKGMVD